MSQFQERIAKIIAEISGVRSQYNVTDWEWQRLQEWRDRGQSWGSDKQLKVLEQIEEKVAKAKVETDGDD